ncbi:hypothetical protein J32TS6_18780 [Virgibacillus pantothenticus]|uniref:hypothetical protein n=1 Tax=Virgibacillus pantothenticus TaxID=1473 RepID=UPI001B1941E6|nr:hypothetical protein [Virgibacillus pantothenticus]GIP63323.1 hypothetical protein J32TS6_18780 [Virgibacillus pantothenticus]
MDFEKHFLPRDIELAETLLESIESNMHSAFRHLDKGELTKAENELYSALNRVNHLSKLYVYAEGFNKAKEIFEQYSLVSNIVSEALNNHANKQN